MIVLLDEHTLLANEIEALNDKGDFSEILGYIHKYIHKNELLNPSLSRSRNVSNSKKISNLAHEHIYWSFIGYLSDTNVPQSNEGSYAPTFIIQDAEQKTVIALSKPFIDLLNFMREQTKENRSFFKDMVMAKLYCEQMTEKRSEITRFNKASIFVMGVISGMVFNDTVIEQNITLGPKILLKAFLGGLGYLVFHETKKDVQKSKDAQKLWQEKKYLDFLDFNKMVKDSIDLQKKFSKENEALQHSDFKPMRNPSKITSLVLRSFELQQSASLASYRAALLPRLDVESDESRKKERSQSSTSL